MKVLTKEDIINVVDVSTEKVDIPEWKGCVYVKTMTGAERDAFEQRVHDQKANNKINITGIRSLLLALTICDDAGKNLFSKDEVDKLDKKSAKVISNIFEISQRMNGIGEQEIDELAKNSLSVQKEDIGSDLQKN